MTTFCPSLNPLVISVLVSSELPVVTVIFLVVPSSLNTTTYDCPVWVLIAALGTMSTLVLIGISRVTVTVMPDLRVYWVVLDEEAAFLCRLPAEGVKPAGGVKPAEGVKPAGGEKPLGCVEFPDGKKLLAVVVGMGVREVNSTVTE